MAKATLKYADVNNNTNIMRPTYIIIICINDSSHTIQNNILIGIQVPLGCIIEFTS